MTHVLASLPRLAIMAAIITTMLCWPIAIAAGIVLALLGVPIDEWVTFGGATNRFSGVLGWWGVGFVPALAYSAFVYPWDEQS